MAAALTKIKEHLRASGSGNDNENTIQEFSLEEHQNTEDDLKKPTAEPEAAGVAKLQAAQAVWGRTGKYFLYLGLVLFHSQLQLVLKHFADMIQTGNDYDYLVSIWWFLFSLADLTCATQRA